MSDDYVLVTVRLPKSVAQDPTPENVAAFLGIAPAQINPGFGIIPIDPKTRLFSLMVPSGILETMSNDVRGLIEGSFANPSIAPFGPLE
jgi:hypothetical protein